MVGWNSPTKIQKTGHDGHVTECHDACHCRGAGALGTLREDLLLRLGPTGGDPRLIGALLSCDQGGTSELISGGLNPKCGKKPARYTKNDKECTKMGNVRDLSQN